MKGGGDCLFIIRERGKFSKAKARFNEYTLIQVLVGATKRQLEDTVCMASAMKCYEGDVGGESSTQCSPVSMLCSGGAVTNFVYRITEPGSKSHSGRIHTPYSVCW